MLFTIACDRYERAARLLGIQTSLGNLLVIWKTFDHRVLQSAHDHLAAYYRFFKDDGGQIPLPFDGDVPYDILLHDCWTDYFSKELRRLIADDDAVTIAIITAVAYENTEPGYAAETHLLTLLRERYPFTSAKQFEGIVDAPD